MESLTGSGGVSSQLLKRRRLVMKSCRMLYVSRNSQVKRIRYPVNRCFDIYLVNLFRTDKENMIGLNGIFPEIDHVFS